VLCGKQRRPGWPSQDRMLPKQAEGAVLPCHLRASFCVVDPDRLLAPPCQCCCCHPPLLLTFAYAPATAAAAAARARCNRPLIPVNVLAHLIQALHQLLWRTHGSGLSMPVGDAEAHSICASKVGMRVLSNGAPPHPPPISRLCLPFLPLFPGHLCPSLGHLLWAELWQQRHQR